MHIEKLNNIKQVDVPPYLFTRIQQRISSAKQLSKKTAWALSLAFGAVLLINVGVIVFKTQANTKAATVAESMNIIPHNSLY